MPHLFQRPVMMSGWFWGAKILKNEKTLKIFEDFQSTT